MQAIVVAGNEPESQLLREVNRRFFTQALVDGIGTLHHLRIGKIQLGGIRILYRRSHGRPLSINLSSSNCTLRSEEHTSELQSLMRISYAVFCLKKKKQTQH